MLEMSAACCRVCAPSAWAGLAAELTDLSSRLISAHLLTLEEHCAARCLALALEDAQDLARSPSGWIKTSALIAYNGSSIPGNFDTHSGEIVDTSTFLLKVHKLSQPLTDEYIKGLVSMDNLRGPKRFLLGLYSPGKTTNSTQLVIRLTSIPAADPDAGAASASSLQTSRLLTLEDFFF